MGINGSWACGFFFFLKAKQLESHCQTEKRVQQSQKEKLNTKQTKHHLPG